MFSSPAICFWPHAHQRVEGPPPLLPRPWLVTFLAALKVIIFTHTHTHRGKHDEGGHLEDFYYLILPGCANKLNTAWLTPTILVPDFKWNGQRTTRTTNVCKQYLKSWITKMKLFPRGLNAMTRLFAPLLCDFQLDFVMGNKNQTNQPKKSGEGES